MEMFSIAGPGGFVPNANFFQGNVVGKATAGQAAAGNTGNVNVCVEDRFSITGTNGATPVICGMNNGQHMIVDTDGQTCVKAMFSFGSATTQRQYNIHVVQYTTSGEGGPPGCLQYFNNPLGEGTVTTFNYQGHADLVSSIHLANQHYKVCVRPIANACQICCVETMPGAAAAIGSFGVSSASGNGNDDSVVGIANCVADYITIKGGNPDAMVGTATDAMASAGMDRYCGRVLNPANAQAAGVAVCSAVRPFELGVHFDMTEVVDAAGGNNMQLANEFSATANDPLGTMGFSLNFAQTAC